ncbi:MBL fold metallo-hydrolase [Candidatus Woesearchaeota archaeon]|nr:MBL fold metallo-hydrolase [Candidatus Woesearchaeota archaeon]
MPSQLLFLGTGGDANLTAKGIRKSGGLILNVNEVQIHIDPGPGGLQESAVRGQDPQNTSLIIASHEHTNHSHDANAIIAYTSKNGTDKKCTVIGSESVTKNIPENIAGWCKSVNTMIPGKKILFEEFEILPIKAIHNDPSATGIQIFTPELIIGYTGDTKFDKSMSEEFEGADILIMNTKHLMGEKSATNLTTNDAIKMVGLVKPKLAIMTHFSTKFHEANPLYEAREVQRKTEVQTIAAVDGLSIDPNSYSAKLRTKTLNLFK